jgi:hypothetical protein
MRRTRAVFHHCGSISGGKLRMDRRVYISVDNDLADLIPDRPRYGALPGVGLAACQLAGSLPLWVSSAC